MGLEDIIYLAIVAYIFVTLVGFLIHGASCDNHECAAWLMIPFWPVLAIMVVLLVPYWVYQVIRWSYWRA